MYMSMYMCVCTLVHTYEYVCACVCCVHVSHKIALNVGGQLVVVALSFRHVNLWTELNLQGLVSSTSTHGVISPTPSHH